MEQQNPRNVEQSPRVPRSDWPSSDSQMCPHSEKQAASDAGAMNGKHVGTPQILYVYTVYTYMHIIVHIVI